MAPLRSELGRLFLLAAALSGAAGCTNDYDRFGIGTGGGTPTTTSGTGGSGGATVTTGSGGTGGSGGATVTTGSGGMGGAGGQGGTGGGTVEGLALDDHPLGQVTNKFEVTAALPPTELFAFELVPSASVDLMKVEFALSNVSGLNTMAVTSARLYQDAGTPGVFDAADVQVGPDATVMVNGGVGTVTLQLAAPMTMTSPVRMLLVLGVDKLKVGDSMTISLDPASVSAVGTTSQLPLTVTGATTAAVHEVALANLMAGDTMLYYGQGAVTTPFVRSFDASSLAWSDPAATIAADTTIRWVLTPDTVGKDEILAVLSDSGGTPELDLLRRTGNTWAVDWTSTGITGAQAQRRPLDIEREATSGDTMVVYGDNTNTPKYRVYSGGTWSAEAPVRSAAGAGNTRWVDLVSRPGTDELTLVYTDGASDLTAITWDGTAWGPPTVLEQTVLSLDFLGFGAAYESVSGDLLVAWGRADGGVAGFRWARRAAGGTSYAGNTMPEAAPLSKPGVLRMASEPGTNRIAIAYLEYTCGGNSCDDFIAAIWDGATDSWTSKLRLDPDIDANYGGQIGAIPVAVAWLGTSGTAVAVYADGTGGGTGIDWAKWDAANGWVLQADFAATPAMGQRVNVRALSTPNQAGALFLIGDANGDLFAKGTDGTTWSDLGGALETSLSTVNAGAFGAAIKK